MATEAVRLSPSNEISRCITHYFAGPVMALNIHFISEPIPQGHVLLHLQNLRSGASSLLTLARAGGGGSKRHPHEFFWNGIRTAGRIALKFCTAYGAFFAQLLAKKIDRVRSGHGAMTS